MAEYIDVASLLLAFGEEPIVWTGSDCELQARGDYRYYKAIIENIPTADVVEVRHARWEWGYRNGQYGIWCTNCGTGWVDSENAEWIAREHDYCPRCGAKMDGKGEGE